MEYRRNLTHVGSPVIRGNAFFQIKARTEESCQLGEDDASTIETVKSLVLQKALRSKLNN